MRRDGIGGSSKWRAPVWGFGSNCRLFHHRQVVTNRDTQETLLCVAYVFEVSASEHGAQHHIYRLVKE